MITSTSFKDAWALIDSLITELLLVLSWDVMDSHSDGSYCSLAALLLGIVDTKVSMETPVGLPIKELSLCP